MLSPEERPKFLMELLAEVDGFDALYLSHDPVKPGEIEHGTLSPWLIRAYSLSRYYIKQCKLLCVERDYEDGEAMSTDPEIMAMKCKAEVLMEMFWATARAEFKLFAAPSIGVRQGFVIISSDKKETGGDSLRKFLNQMFGG